MKNNIEIKIYNSLTNKLETFKPIKEGEVSMYVCGATVYNHPHIGNARPVIFFDTVKRFLQYVGYKVTYVTNFTDIDDKIIKKAKEQGKTEKEVADYYIQSSLNLYRALNCEMDVIRPRVTEFIPEITSFIKDLVDKNCAYTSRDDVYFKVASDDKYGVLSNQKVDELEVGARIDVNQGKLDPRDFTLWKLTSDDGIKWDSPFGKGRPGWHTECVVMIDKIFGGMIDIHGGGTDLKFPHHENEIAQSYCLHNNFIANYWMHNGRIDLVGEKMSKSLGNVVWAKDIVKKYHPNAFRLAILSNHYRQLVNYQDDLMIQMQKEWEKIEKAYISLYRKVELSNTKALGNVLPVMDLFVKEMSYDFNTANTFEHLSSLIKLINKDLRDPNCAISNYLDELKTLSDMLYILGIKVHVSPLSESEKELANKWIKARLDKDFELADETRKKINELDIKL